MTLKHACFVSYRHRPTKEYKETIDDLYKVLFDEVVYWLSTQEPYMDTARLQGGDFFNKALATALCESVCMVLLYIPPYFDEDYTYCTREYKAMEKLEKRRQKLLGAHDNKTSGLIIPIICRGWDSFPDEIKEERQCYNFEPYLMEVKRISEHPKGVQELKQIAKYIFERYKELKNVSLHPSINCSKFYFPKEDEVLPWLTKVQSPKSSFPRIK